MKNDEGEDGSIIKGKALERYFALNDALLEFTLLFRDEDNERAAAIVGAAFLDTLLENILTNYFVDDEKEIRNLLKTDRPIGTYGSRTSVAYCLGLIGAIVRDDLRLVGKIRNRFAHDLHASFNDDPIRSWCLSLRWHAISFMSPPQGASPSQIFEVGVNQLVTHLNGIVSIARMEKRHVRQET
jgi:hypothetical protein